MAVARFFFPSRLGNGFVNIARIVIANHHKLEFVKIQT